MNTTCYLAPPGEPDACWAQRMAREGAPLPTECGRAAIVGIELACARAMLVESLRKSHDVDTIRRVSSAIDRLDLAAAQLAKGA